MVQHQEEHDFVAVQQFFAERGLKLERIPNTTTKTPDFQILRGDIVVAYCEVKSPQDVFPERIADAIRQATGAIIDIGNDTRQGRCIARAAGKSGTAIHSYESNSFGAEYFTYC